MLELMYEFLLIGMLTFGGGSAATPIIHSRLVEDKKWISNDEFIDVVAMANVLPGPSMIQMATIIGMRRTNKLGGILSAFMISAPSIILFVFVMALLTSYVNPEMMSKVTAPIFIVIAISMAVTALKVMENNRKYVSDLKQLILVLLTFILIIVYNVPTVLVIVVVIILSGLKAVMFK